MAEYVFKLYIAGQNTRAQRAINNLHRICDQQLDGNYEIEIIDVLEEPATAEKDKIFATPTLVKIVPRPTYQMIGDLTDTSEELARLNINGE